MKFNSPTWALPGYVMLFSALYGLLAPTGFLADVATTFMLKDQLKATAGQVSLFRLATVSPFYVAFAFGLTRDLWNPLGRRDRGYFMLFGALAAVAFLVLAFLPVTFGWLLTGMLAAGVCACFVSTAALGLLALLGQENRMSGRLVTARLVVITAMNVAGSFLGGVFAEHLAPRITFLILAALCLALSLFGLWKPRAVFEAIYEKPQAKGAGFVADLKRLVRHRAIYPPVLMMLLFQFAPGGNTPLQYYLTDVLHASDQAYGLWQAIFLGSFVPVFLLYGWLCARVSFEKLIWWGTFITVPQFVPLLFVHSVNSALLAAVPMGAMGAIFAVAVWDLTVRSCPPGLQGTLMATVLAVDLLSLRASDVLGSWIYTSSATPARGFMYCVIAITLVYALILPLIPFIPKELIRTSDARADEVGSPGEQPLVQPA